MKKIFLVTALLSAFVFSYSQSPLPLGKTQLNMGVGFSDWGVPIYIGLDYSAHKDITIGGELSFRSYDDRFNGTGYSHTIIGFSANGNYHFNTVLDIPRNWDFYVGLNLGFYSWANSTDYPGNRSSGIGLGAQVGGRYYFTQKIGINLEVGGGNAFSGGKIGITIKL